MAKERLDKLLVQQGLCETREKAQAIIMAGGVMVEGKVHDKPGTKYPEGVLLEIVANPIPFVSRGGLKLAKAIESFNILVNEKDCMDVGASTGGFTDCLLQNGARRVVAIDVGYGQLAWSLRCDPRVTVMEKTNIRYLAIEDLPFTPELITIDTSFISLTKFLQILAGFLPPGGELVALIKPQFEAGPSQVGKGGIVRDLQVHKEVIERVLTYAHQVGLHWKGLTYSPIKGTKGNTEYLAYFTLGGVCERSWDEAIDSAIYQAQSEL